MLGQVQELFALLLASNQDAGQDAVHQGAEQRLVAAANLAGDHCRPQHAFGMIIGRRHLGVVQEHEPLIHVIGDVVGEAFQFGAWLSGQVVQPQDETVLHPAGATLIGFGSQLVATLGQVNGVLDDRDEPVEILVFLVRDGVVEVLGAAQQMPIALPFLVFEGGVSEEAINDQVAVEVRSEDFFGDILAAPPLPVRMA